MMLTIFATLHRDIKECMQEFMYTKSKIEKKATAHSKSIQSRGH